MSHMASTSSGSLAVSTGANVIPSATRTSGVSSGRVMGLSITPAAAVSTLSIYDNNVGDASGLLLERLTVPANSSTVVIAYDDGTAFANGLSYVLSGTGAIAVIRYVIGG